MNPPKLLITGASGFLGWHLGQAAASAWDVYGISSNRPVLNPAVQNRKVDLTDAIALRTALEQIQPDAILHSAALSRPNDCQQEPERSFAINVLASWQIADYCAERNIPCVFTSTDQVFDGTRAPYREGDPVAPINRYGEHKVLAETGMQARYPQTVICRLPLLYGFSPQGETFLRSFLTQLQAGKTLQLFTDEVRTPVSGQSAAQGLLLALPTQQPCLHLGGSERLSRYRFGEVLVTLLDLPQSALEPCRQADLTMPAPRPQDVSLDSTLAYQLGYAPTPVEPDLQAMLQTLSQ
jgi:dTDP-4-dehydrorhamnose reductase